MDGLVKCNIHTNWRNAQLHSGGVWITRDHRDIVGHHAHDAFTCSTDRYIGDAVSDLGSTKHERFSCAGGGDWLRFTRVN